MACPFLDEVMDEEALILRRALRMERVFQDRYDPFAFSDARLYERYRFSGAGLRYICRLLGPRISNPTARSQALTVPQQVCIALRFFACGTFLYTVGDAEHLSKATVCRTIRRVYLALKSFAPIFIKFPGHRGLNYIKEDFYQIGGRPMNLSQNRIIIRIAYVTFEQKPTYLLLLQDFLMSLGLWIARILKSKSPQATTRRTTSIESGTTALMYK